MQLELPASTQPFRSHGSLNPQSQTGWPKREEESLKAYVLIQTETSREPIAQTLLEMPGVLSAQDLSGPFDAIALAWSDSTRGLADQVVAKIQQLPGVIRALSAPLIGSPQQVLADAPRSRGEAA
jgi:AsnC-like helix-turn-helix protein